MGVGLDSVLSSWCGSGRLGSWLCENAWFDVIPAIWFVHDSKGNRMGRFVAGTDRGQRTLFPECLEDWIGENNPVRVIDVFVDALNLVELRFGGVEPEATGRPSYHPSCC
jgi:hypothetical protein